MPGLLAAGSEASLLEDLLGMASIPILVALNGFFVAAEFALVAVRRTRVEEMIAQGVVRARAVQSAIDHLDRSIASTQLGITLSSLGLGWVAESAMTHVFEGLFAGAASPWNVLATHTVAAAIAFTLITFLHVVFGELFPKTVALQAPDKVSLWVAYPLELFTLVTRPFIYVMNGTGNALARMFGFVPSPESHVHSVEELALLIEDTEEAGILDPDQADLVVNVFRLSLKKVKDIMVPRDKMAVLELSTPEEKVLERVRTEAHTRMPIYAGEIDNIIGIVNTKDLFYLFSLKGVVVLEDAVYPAIFLKPEEEVANALRLFKKAKRHMALVRDEDGKIHGLLTLEDILEEIIGDIEDEHDYKAAKVSRFKLWKMRRRPGEKKP